MKQEAPDPVELQHLVDELRYKDGWTFTLEDLDRGQGSIGLTLCILIAPPDAYHSERLRKVMHYMPVPPAAFDKRSWRRWLFDQIIDVETHEACEFFRFELSGKFVTGGGAEADTYVERPFAPHHGPGNNPYTIFEHGLDVDARTSFRGEVKPA